MSTDDLGATGLEAAFWALEDLVVAGFEASGREAVCLAGVRSEAFLVADGLFDVCAVCAAVFSLDLADPAELLALLLLTADFAGLDELCCLALRAAC